MMMKIFYEEEEGREGGGVIQHLVIVCDSGELS